MAELANVIVALNFEDNINNHMIITAKNINCIITSLLNFWQ